MTNITKIVTLLVLPLVATREKPRQRLHLVVAKSQT